MKWLKTHTTSYFAFSAIFFHHMISLSTFERNLLTEASESLPDHFYPPRTIATAKQAAMLYIFHAKQLSIQEWT